MLYPLFDKEGYVVAWVQDERHVFDTAMRWVAFIERGYVFSAESNKWLGLFMDRYCTDKEGRVFAWNNRETLLGSPRPIPPVPPLRPTRPASPLAPDSPTWPLSPKRPRYGWSPYGLRGWLAQ